MSSFLRPDEKASQHDIQKSHKFDKLLKKGVKSAAGLATAATGIGISSKILPFLSEFIPADLALKGISKVSPKIGDFLNKGLKAGLDLKSGLDFLKEKIQPEEEKEDKYQPLLDKAQQMQDRLSNLDSEVLQGSQQGQQTQSQGGQGQEALMAILQKINQARGRQ
jgi:hypothetical protein